MKLEDYEDQMITQITDSFDLGGQLTYEPATSNWRKLVKMMAFATFYFIEKVMAKFYSDVAEIEARVPVQTLPWYRAMALKFQLGYILNWSLEKGLFYDSIDAAACIINAASVRLSANREVEFRVAKMSGGVYIPLSASESAAFGSYVNKFIAPGTKFNVISLNSDYVRLWVNVQHNAEIPKAVFMSEMIEKLEAFRYTFAFDGKLRVQQVIDVIQSVTGYVDHYAFTLERMSAGESTYTVIDMADYLFAGHFEWVFSDGFGNTTLEFEAV